MEARPSTHENPQILTVPDAAKITGFSENHIRKAIGRGEFPGVKVGGAYKISARQFWAWFEAPVERPAPTQEGGWS